MCAVLIPQITHQPACWSKQDCQPALLNMCAHAQAYAQVTADKYESLDKELLQFVEDVLLNKRPDATERILEYAANLDPQSKPTAVKKLNDKQPEEQAPQITPRLNPIDGLARIAVPDPMPPVPSYRAWVDPVRKSPHFEQVSSTCSSAAIPA